MNSAPRSIFITGANRGIGLEFVRQLLALPTPPKHIIATCRCPEKAGDLQGLAKESTVLKIMKYDACELDTLSSLQESVAEVVGEDGINLLLLNAGCMVRDSLDSVTGEAMMNVFKVNTVAPLMMTKAFLPLLKKCAASSKGELGCQNSMVANVSSKVGSISDNGWGTIYAYRSSKCALNMITKNLSIDLAPQGILVLALHPGWVQTDMGGPNALISSSVSVTGMLNVMAGATEKESGKFYDYKGIDIPW